MEAYFEAKATLFDKLKPDGKAVVNTDDAWGLKLAQRLVTKGTRSSPWAIWRMLPLCPSKNDEPSGHIGHFGYGGDAGSAYAR